MSKVVYKARRNIDPYGRIRIHMDVEGKVLCAQMQEGFITIWYESERAPLQTGDREFYVIPTGLMDIPEDGAYINTVQDGEFVWHIYEKVVVE